MSFDNFDDGTNAHVVAPFSAAADETQTVKITSFDRARAETRRIRQNIEAHECLEKLAQYMDGESLLIDALFLFDEAMAREIEDLAADHSAHLKHGSQSQETRRQAASVPGGPGISTCQTDNKEKAKTMNAFAQFDAGAQGSEGPWIAWSALGTRDGAVPRESFYIRDEGGKSPITTFETTGVVMDVHNMKTGWQRSDGVQGQAPDWKWNASITQMADQPGDDYKKGFSIPCALGKDKRVTWEQAGAAAWGSFVALVPALQAGDAVKLPVVRMTGTKAVNFKKGSTVEPIFEIVKWVDRPDCLKADVQRIATDPPKAAPAPEPKPEPKAETTAHDGDEW